MAAMANPISNGRAGRAGGFTYVGLIILLAILGLVAAAGIKMGTVMQRAAAEEELLEIGAQFSAALRSYAAATPRGQPAQPPTLQELLKDPRFPNTRRHLRKIFVDPITGESEWGILYLNGEKGVIGVHSLSDKRPLKITNFDARFPNFENKEKLSQWQFTIAGGGGLLLAVPLVPPQPAPAPPSLFGQQSGAATKPVEAPVVTEAAPPVEPPSEPEAEEKTQDPDAKPVTPVDDGRIDETRRRDERRESDTRTPGRPPPGSRR